jgi:hypothetical protein
MSQPERGGPPQPHPQGVPMVNPSPLDHLTTVTGAQFPVVEEAPDGNGERRLVLKEHVVVFHSTPAGTAVLVLQLDKAEKIAMDIYGAVRRMRSNIVLPEGTTSIQEIVREAMEKHLKEQEQEENDA